MGSQLEVTTSQLGIVAFRLQIAQNIIKQDSRIISQCLGYHTHNMATFERRPDRSRDRSESLPTPRSPRAPPPTDTFTLHFGPESAVWAPYAPRTPRSQALTKRLETPTIEELFTQQELPFHLRTLNERDRISIAYASEGCNILVDQRSLSERRYRQLLLLTRAQELDTAAIEADLRQAEEGLDAAVITALHSVLAAFTPEAGGCTDPCQSRHSPQLPSKYFNAVAR